MKTFVDIDQDELTLRIAEGCLGQRKPPEQTTEEALQFIRSASPEGYAGFERAARYAAEYIAGRINSESPGQALFAVGNETTH